MATLSLAMIVKNEERTLRRILEAAKDFCDEMIVVDTGSTDATIQIATDMGAKVVHFPWIDDFAAARNHAFSQATMDWIVWYDADDVLSPESREAVRALKATAFEDPNLDVVYAPYHVLFNASGEVTQKYDRERFLRRSAGYVWKGAVHEAIATHPLRRMRCPEAYVEHDPHLDNLDRKIGRNLRIIEKTIDIHNDPTHEVFQYGCELHWNHRAADAANVFRCFTTREDGQPDDLGEQYLAYIKMADCLNQCGNVDEALRACRDAIGLDSTRAEAYCLAGRFLMAQNKWKEAWPFLVAASSVRVPVDSPNIVFTWFYNDAARREVITCAENLEERAALTEQLKLLTSATMSTLSEGYV